MAKDELARWCCANRDCDSFMLAVKTERRAEAPTCVCGGTMKKVEMLAVMNYLDFLRRDLALEEKTGTNRG